MFYKRWAILKIKKENMPKNFWKHILYILEVKKQ